MFFKKAENETKGGGVGRSENPISGTKFPFDYWKTNVAGELMAYQLRPTQIKQILKLLDMN